MKNNIEENKIKKLIFLIIALVILQGCIPILRSAKGLEPGEVKVAYNTPACAEIRVGVTEHTELRASLIGESFGADVMQHYHNDNFDYGFALGYSLLPRSSLAISKKISIGFSAIASTTKDYFNGNININPYLGFSNLYKFHEEVYVPENRKKHTYYFSFGIESFVLKKKFPFYLSLTPEIIWSPHASGQGFDPKVWADLSIGIMYNF